MATPMKTGQLFQGADGKTYRYVGPDGQAPRRSTIEVYYDPAESKPRPFKPEAPSGAASVGRGMMDLVQGVEQIGRRAFGDDQETAAWEQAKNAENQLYEQGQGDNFDWGRLGGQIAGAAPLGVFGGGAATTGLLGRAAIGAGIGAAEGGTLYADTSKGDFASQKVMGTALGATGGLLGGVVAPGIQRLAGRLSGPAKALWRSMQPEKQQELVLRLQQAAEANGTRWDDLGEELQAQAVEAATKQMSITGELDADAIIRKARMERMGFTGEAGPMRAQVTSDPRDYAELQDLYGSPEGSPAIERSLAQNTQAHRGVGNVVGALSRGEPLTPGVLTGPRLQAPLTASEVPYAAQGVGRRIERASQRQVREEYRKVQKTPGLAQLAPNFDRLNARVTEVFNEYPAGVRESLPRRVLDLVDGKLTPSVDNIIDAFKNVNRLSSKTTDPTLGSFYGEIGTTLHSTLDEIAQEGGEAAAQLLKANKLAAQRFGVLRGRGRDKFKIVEGLLNGDIKMSNFVSERVAKGDPHELFALRRFLTEFPEEFTYIPRKDGQAAWNQIRAAVMDDLASKAKMGDPAKNEFNGRKFREYWQGLGTMRQRALFTDEEIRFVDDLTAAIQDLTAAPAGPKKYSKSDSSTWLRNALASLRSNGGPLGVLARKLIESPEEAAKARAQRQLSKRALSGDTVSADKLDEYLRRGGSASGIIGPVGFGAGSNAFADQNR